MFQYKRKPTFFVKLLNEENKEFDFLNQTKEDMIMLTKNKI
jgi:hypothetical protein